MKIPSGTVDQPIYFVAVDATDFTTRETGLSSFTVYRSRNGGAAAAYTTPTVTELDATNMPGVYSLLLDEDTTIDAGDDSQEYCVHITHAGMAPVTRTIELYRPKITLGETLTASDITAIKAKTDNLPTDPADASTIDASFTTVNDTLVLIAGYVDSEVAAIKAVTDKLDTALELDGAVYRYTTNALELAPTGGSAPTAEAIADAVWDEVLTGAEHNIVNSAGRRLRQVDASSILGGTATAGASNSITLDGSASATNEIYDGNLIVITGGTGMGQTRIIVEYNGTTKVAIVNRVWEVNPDATSEYEIIADHQADISDHGLAQGGTSSTITLAATASATDDLYVGEHVYLSTSNGAGQTRLITDYDGTTKVATVSPDWVVNPTSSSVYKIIPFGLVTANVTQVSGDATAADNLEAMLDGTGTSSLTLRRLVIANNTSDAAVAISNSSTGGGLSIAAPSNNAIELTGAGGINISATTAYGIYVSGSVAAVALEGTGGPALSLYCSDATQGSLQITNEDGPGVRAIGGTIGIQVSGADAISLAATTGSAIDASAAGSEPVIKLVNSSTGSGISVSTVTNNAVYLTTASTTTGHAALKLEASVAGAGVNGASALIASALSYPATVSITGGGGAVGCGLEITGKRAAVSILGSGSGNPAFIIDQSAAGVALRVTGVAGGATISASSGTGLFVSGGTSSTGYGIQVYGGGSRSGIVVFGGGVGAGGEALALVGGGTTGPCLAMYGSANGSGVYIDTYGTGPAVDINNSGTGVGIDIDVAGNTGIDVSGTPGILVNGNADSAIELTAAGTEPTVKVTNTSVTNNSPAIVVTAVNGDAVSLTGGGAWNGIRSTGGSSGGHGVSFIGGAGAGNGMVCIAPSTGQGLSVSSTSGTAMTVSGFFGAALSLASSLEAALTISGSTGQAAINVINNGAGDAIRVTSGSAGSALELLGGNSSPTVRIVNSSTGIGIDVNAGGNGVNVVGDVGMYLEGTAGVGLSALGSTTPLNQEVIDQIQDGIGSIGGGGGTLNPEDIRSAIGMSSANLDDQLNNLPTNAELTEALAFMQYWIDNVYTQPNNAGGGAR